MGLGTLMFGVGILAISQLMRGKGPDDQYGSKLDDLSVTSATFGAHIPKSFGSYRVAGNIIWSEGIKETSHVKEEEAGKGGSESYDVTWYTYSVTLAVGVCEGTIGSISKVWADSLLIYDAAEGGYTSSILNQDDSSGVLTFYDGSPAQPVDWVMQASNIDTPAYRNLAYVLFTDFQLDLFNNRIPNFTFEVNTTSPPETLPMLLGGHVPHPGTRWTDGWTRPTLGKCSTVGGILNGIKVIGKNEEDLGTFDGWAEYHILNNDQVRKDKTYEEMTYSHVDGSPLGIKYFAGNGAWAESDEDLLVYNKNNYIVNSHNTYGAQSFNKETYHLATGRWDGSGAPIPYSSVDKRFAHKVVRKNGIYYVMHYKISYYYFFNERNLYGKYIWKLNPGNAGVSRKLAKATPPAVQKYECLAGPRRIASRYVNPDEEVCSRARGKMTNYMIPDNIIDYYDPPTPIVDFSEFPYRSANNQDFCVGEDVLYFIQTNVNSPNDRYRLRTYSISNGELIDDVEIMDPNIHSYYSMKIIQGVSDNIVYLLTFKNIYNVYSIQVFKINTYANYNIRYLGECKDNPNLSWNVWGFDTAGTYNISNGRLYVSGVISYEDNNPWPASNGNYPTACIWSLTSSQYDGQPLSVVVKEILIMSGVLETDIDTSGGDSVNVMGFTLTRAMSARTAISELQSIYLFDLVERDFKLYLVMRGDQTLERTITDDDVINPMQIKNALDTELPKNVIIKYSSKNIDYQAGSQETIVIDGNSDNNISFDTNIVLTDNEAKRLTEKVVYSSLNGKTTVELEIPLDLTISLGSLIRIESYNISFDARVEKITYESGGVMKMELTKENSGSYTSDAIGSDTGEGFVSNVPSEYSKTDFEVFNAPHFHNDYINAFGIYYVAKGITEDWNGCEMFKSRDEGVTFSSTGAILTPCVFGVTTSELQDAKPSAWDAISTVTVNVGDGVLYSVTNEEVVDGSNYALVGKEVIQYQYATLIDYGIYELSNLVRGRQGTEQYTSNHESNEKFFFVLGTQFSFADIGLERIYNAVSFRRIIDYKMNKEATYDGTNLTPLSPSMFKYIEQLNTDLEFTWMRRDRYNSSGFQTKPLSEQTERYILEFYFNSLLVRTMTIDNETIFTYTSAMQVIDGDIDLVKVYQYSADLLSVGYSSEVTI